jgi:DNA processing protein
MRAPFVAEAANLTPRRSLAGTTPNVPEGAPCLARADMMALWFVRGLPRDAMYSLLRGDPDPADTPSNARPARLSPGEPLENVLERLGCLDAGDRAAAARRMAARALAAAQARGVEALAWGDDRYPPLLTRIFDPPLILWVRGSVDSLSADGLAIVGSRAASVYGEETATRLATDLASRGLVIVSGLARGIDAAAHRGALAAGGRTVAVLGCGVDVVYPPEHGELMQQVARSGAVVSELPLGSSPQPGNFPQRNRIISGLSRAVVVVEARQRSGALITADCALEQGREVLAVPGSVLGERHRGSHTLLKAGAALVETAADVLDVLKMTAGPGGTPVSAPVEHDRLLEIMDVGESYALDTLAAMSGDDVTTLLPRLLSLELQGRVRRLPGGRFGRCMGNVLT